MAYCNELFGGIIKNFSSLDESCSSAPYTIMHDGQNQIIFSCEKSPNVPALVYLKTDDGLFDLSSPVYFDTHVNFKIVVFYNGTQESFNVNILNVSCDNQNFMNLTLNYQG